MADSTRSNSRKMRTASSSMTPGILNLSQTYKSQHQQMTISVFAYTRQAKQATYLKDDTLGNLAIFFALFFSLGFKIFIHLSPSHHVLRKHGFDVKMHLTLLYMNSNKLFLQKSP